MKHSLPASAALVAAAVLSALPAAGEDYTVGFDSVVCEAGAETKVNVPFRRPTSFSGSVSGTPVQDSGSAVVTAAGSPSFPAGAFTDEAHYLLFTGGSLAGQHFSVTSHDAVALTIATAGADLSRAGSGDSFEVVPFWTLETLLPVASQGTIHVSSSTSEVNRKSELILPGAGTCFLTSGGWVKSEPGFPSAADVVIPPRTIFTIRHPEGEAATAFVTQQVLPADARIETPDSTVGKTSASQKGDNKYNRSGAGQKFKQVSKNRRKLKFLFHLQNDGAFRETIQLTTTPKDKYFKAKYFRISGGRTNVTAALKRDDYEKELVGHEEERFKLDVKPSRKAKRMKKTFTIDALVGGDLKDRAKALVKAK